MTRSLACRALEQFVEARTFDEYEQNLMLRSAVERQLEIIGEAWGRPGRGRNARNAPSQTSTHRGVTKPRHSWI